MQIKQKYVYSGLLLLGYLISALAFTACTRPDGEKTSVTITLPSSIDSSAIMSNVTTQSFGVPNPTAYSSLNCFFVFVSGPEPTMSDSQCTVGATSVPVGFVAGGLAGGSSITLDVPSGDSRVISLAGIKTDGSIACPDLNTFDSLKAHMSNPVLAGSSAPTNLVAGASVPISIPVSAALTASQLIGNCSGPAFNSFGGNGSGGGTPAGYIIAAQDSGTSFAINSCIPMQLKIVDAGGSGANVSGTYTVNLGATAGVVLSNNSNCSSGVNPLSMTFTSFNTQQFFAKMPASAISPIAFSTTASSGTVILPNAAIPGAGSFASVVDGGAPYTIAMVDTMSLLTLGLNAGSVPPSYNCRNYYIQVQDHLNHPVAAATTGATSNSLTATSSLFNFYSDQFCATTATGNVYNFGTSVPLINLVVYGTITAPTAATSITFGAAMSGSTPAISSGFSLSTTTSPAATSQLGLLNSFALNFSPANVMSFKRPGTGCVYGGEIGYFDAASVRGPVAGSGGIQFSGLPAGILYSQATASLTYDFGAGGSASPVLGVGPSSVTAYKIPIYVCSTSTLGSYSMTVSGYSALSGTYPGNVVNFTVDP